MHDCYLGHYGDPLIHLFLPFHLKILAQLETLECTKYVQKLQLSNHASTCTV